jgi:hypothetical protein
VEIFSSSDLLIVYHLAVHTGNQTWLKVQWLSDLTCVFLYYTLTTLLDNQTLGEEYVGLIQVNPTLRALPSKLVNNNITSTST